MLSNLPSSDELIRKRVGTVEWVIFNRPAVRNALTHWMETQLIQICRELNDDSTVRALVLTGAPGNKPAFVAGADMGDLSQNSSAESFMELEKTSEDMNTAIEELRIPTIAAIAGACVGVGALIAACCDIRIAAPSVRFGFPIARTVGNCLSVKNYSRLCALVGASGTRNLIFDATLLEGRQVLEKGVVREIVDEEDHLIPRAQDVAERLSELAPLTLRSTKEALLRMRDATISHVEDRDLLLRCYLSEDYRRAISAFVEKRTPEFVGR